MRRGWLEDLMKGTLQRSVSLSMALCLLLLSGVIYAQTVPHTLHHAKHQAATHSTALCSWLCAAGQVLDGAPAILQAGLGPITTQWVNPRVEPISIESPTIPVRGPPVLSV
jgi:hypothetical protein